VDVAMWEWVRPMDIKERRNKKEKMRRKNKNKREKKRRK
jgi:hypothetical protein